MQGCNSIRDTLIPTKQWMPTPAKPDQLGGIGYDFGRVACEMCGFECTYLVDHWDQCWNTHPHLRIVPVWQYHLSLIIYYRRGITLVTIICQYILWVLEPPPLYFLLMY